MTTVAPPDAPPSGAPPADAAAGEVSAGPDVSLGAGLRVLLPFARHGARAYASSAVLAVLGTFCQLVPFWIVYQAVSEVVQGDATRGELYRLGLVAVASVVAMTVLLGASTWLSHRAAFATLEQLRLRIGERLGRVPLGFLSNRRAGEIQRTLNDDVEKLEVFLAHAIPDLVSAVVVIVVTTVWIFTVDWRMALATVAVLVVAMPMMSIGMRRGSSKMADYLAAMSRMNGSIVEFVRGLPVIRTFNRSDEAFQETRDAIVDAARFQADWGREFLPMFTAFFTLLAANVVTITPIGVWLWHRGSLSTVDLLFFFVVGIGYPAPVLKLMEFTTMIGHLSLGAGMVLELDGATELVEVPGRATLDGAAGVEVDSVVFSHLTPDGDRREVLHGVSFAARPGTVTALVGPSGSGKSTLARLLCRFWDVDAGAVRIGGVDVRAMPFEQLMEQLAFVFQETFLFDDTVAANIRLGRPDATDGEVEAAARAARAHEFISALPDGYQTRLGERGARLSGGERQRLTIARALVKDAPIVILDEATAFSDPENEAALQDALGALVSGKTLIMIAHRLSTVAGADQILVLDGGNIVERGSHAELLARDGTYRRLWAAFEVAETIELGRAVHDAAAPPATDDAGSAR